MDTRETPSLEKWDIRHGSELGWTPWGDEGNARAKILGEGDGYTVALIEAQSGHRTPAHEHRHTEFFYLLEGGVRNQGVMLKAGDGYAASVGSVHSDFEVLEPATLLVIFQL